MPLPPSPCPSKGINFGSRQRQTQADKGRQSQANRGNQEKTTQRKKKETAKSRAKKRPKKNVTPMVSMPHPIFFTFLLLRLPESTSCPIRSTLKSEGRERHTKPGQQRKPVGNNTKEEKGDCQKQSQETAKKNLYPYGVHAAPYFFTFLLVLDCQKPHHAPSGLPFGK